MGIFQILKEAKKFKAHSHIKISGAGVASTTSAHYLNSPKARKAAKAISEMMNTKEEKATEA